MLVVIMRQDDGAGVIFATCLPSTTSPPTGIGVVTTNVNSVQLATAVTRLFERPPSTRGLLTWPS